MAKRCKYIYKGKTYSKEEFMALLAGGEYENILAEYDQTPEAEPRVDLTEPVENKKIKFSISQNSNPVYFENLKKFANESSFSNKIEFKKAIQEKLSSYVNELKKKYGESFNPAVYNEKTKQYLSDIIIDESVNAIAEHPEAIGWYDEKTRSALDVVSAIHPEIATDNEARGAFILPLAVMSNGNLVDFNFDLAEKQYDYFKKNGRFNPVGGFGLQQSGIKKSLLLINSLLDNGLTMSDINTFLTSKYRAGDLKVKIDGKVKNLASGELANEMVYGAVILGPKIGNGFYMNLWGQFDQLTMDRWFMRTWGRLTGTLLKIDKNAIAEGKKRVSDALEAIKSDPKALAILKSVVPKLSGVSPADLAKTIEKASMNTDKRAALASNPKTDELRKAGNSLSKNISGEKEAPANGNERKFIRDVFTDVARRLKEENNIDITMADLQAVLWYPEKILYESFKGGQTFEEASEGYTSESAPDYFNAAKKLAIKLGKNETEINQALSRGRGSINRDIGTTDAGTGRTIIGDNKEILERVTEIISQKKQPDINIKAKASKGVSAIDIVSSDKFSNNASAAVNRVREASGEDGATLNLDGTDYTNGGLVVPAGSLNVSQQEVSEEGLYNFLKSNEQNISSDIFKIGLYRFPDRAEVSYDLNIVIPRKYRDVALEFGRLAGKESLYDLDSNEGAKTGADGKNPVSFTSEQLASIAEDLSNGILPDVEGMLKGDRSDAGSALKDVESTTKALEGVDVKNVLSKLKKFSLKSIDKFYHASSTKRVGRLKKSNAPAFGTGIYFSTNKDLVVGEFGENLTDVTLLLDNPLFTNTKEFYAVSKMAIEEADKDYGKKRNLTLEEDETFFHYDPNDSSEIDEIPSEYISQAAETLGYDAIIDTESSDYENEIIVLDESKIVYEEDLPSVVSEAYHAAKADGSNPELVQAVENLLSQSSILQKGVESQAITDPAPLFKKSQELFEKISDAAGGSKKRSLAEERRKLMDENPDIKFIDDNMAYIYKQIEDNNLGKKEGNCPI